MAVPNNTAHAPEGAPINEVELQLFALEAAGNAVVLIFEPDAFV